MTRRELIALLGEHGSRVTDCYGQQGDTTGPVIGCPLFSAPDVASLYPAR